MISVTTLMFPHFKFPHYTTSVRQLFSVWKPKGDSKIFIKNQLPVKSNQIHGFVECLPPKIQG